jgi:signal transduction histidine kinase
MRLHHRIAIPFAIVAIVTMSGAALLAHTLFSATLEARVIDQVQNTARVLGQSSFALNPQILRSAREITGADIMTFSSNGDVLVTTVDGARQPLLAHSIATAAAAREVLAGTDGLIVVRHVESDAPLVVAYKAVPGSDHTVLAVIADTSELSRATRAITRSILIATAVCLLLMILVSQVVAKRVTAPLDALLEFTRGASPEGSSGRAAIGEDEVGRLAGAFNDMLDRLSQSQDALVRSEKMGLAGLMAARVAHEIRNPLSSIKMQTQLLGVSHASDPTVRPLVDAVLRDIAQVESVVRDLIELARPGELKRRPTPLDGVVLDVLRQMAPQLSYRKIDVQPTLAGGLPPVDLDEGRFRQVLLNIIGNSADAMPTGGTLTLDLHATDDHGALVLEIADDGTGIDPRVRDRVFDPFVSTKRDGVGLGLMNARAVVAGHGGTIELRPSSPRGTVARIILPVSGTVQQAGRTVGTIA